MELARGFGGDGVELAEDGEELAGLLRRGLAEGAGGGALGGAEVTVAAGAKAVGGVAEVLDEGGHAALGGLGEGGHTVDLAAAEGELLIVAGAPGAGTGVLGGTDSSIEFDDGGAL